METKDYYGSPDPWGNIKARVLRLRRERRCEARSRGVSAVDRQCDLRAGHDGPHAAYASHWDRFEWVHNETAGA